MSKNCRFSPQLIILCMCVSILTLSENIVILNVSSVSPVGAVPWVLIFPAGLGPLFHIVSSAAQWLGLPVHICAGGSPCVSHGLLTSWMVIFLCVAFSVTSVPSAFHLPAIPQNFWSTSITHPTSLLFSLSPSLPSSFQSWFT